MDVAALRAKLQELTDREAEAMTRLRRAHTLYQKAYDRRQRVAGKLFAIEHEAEWIAEKLSKS